MTWRLKPIFESYWLVGGAALLLLLLLLLPAFSTLSRRRRLVLLSLRAVVVALVVLAMLRPTCITTTSKAQARVLMLLFDRSRSMRLPDAEGQRQRWQSQAALLDQVRPLLEQADEALEIKLFAFDKELLPTTAGGWRDLQPSGDQTDLGAATSGAVRTQQGRRLAAVFLLSDGVQTAYDTEVDVHQAARQLARLGVPLFTLCLGPAGDATQARDVALESLPEQESAFVRNDLLLTGAVRVRGYVNQPVPVELLAEDPDGQVTRVGQTEVVVRQDGQQAPVEMVFTPTRVGDYKLTMKAAVQDGEMVTANNELSTYVHVREGLRVAYLYGTRLGEQRALRWSLSRANGVQLDHRLVDIRNRSRWPEDHADMMGSQDYDAYILESVDSEAFREQDLQSLADAVAAGKGLMMIGGYHSFGPGGYQNTPLANVLPVQMGRFERQDLDPREPIAKDLHIEPPEGLQLLPVGFHPIMRLASAEGNRAAWEALPRLAGANKLTPAKRAQVLAVSQGGHPLLISGAHGRGRVLALAADSTWRWWQRGRRDEHRRFWRQAVLWLVRRDGQEENEVRIRLDRRRFDPGSRVSMEAAAFDSGGEPIADAQFEAELVLPDQQRRPLPLRREGAEVRGETDRLQEAGDYVIEVRATADGQLLGQTQASFQVVDRDVELSTAAADQDQLQRLAQMTESSGGRLLAPEQLRGQLQEIIEDPPKVEVDSQTSWELASTWWDAWLLFLALTFLLTAEWALRKRWGMV